VALSAWCGSLAQLLLQTGVQYYTGQFFDIEAITKAAHAQVGGGVVWCGVVWCGVMCFILWSRRTVLMSTVSLTCSNLFPGLHDGC
jgi:quinolinate synthase